MREARRLLRWLSSIGDPAKKLASYDDAKADAVIEAAQAGSIEAKLKLRRALFALDYLRGEKRYRKDTP